MRRIWRLLHVLGIAVVYTTWVGLAVRLRPQAERPAFRARRQQVGTTMLCRAMGVRVATQGAPPPGKPMLFVCNHLGVLDPLILGSQMPLAFAGKAEIKTWLLIGWVCRTFGMLFVDRDRRTRTGTFVEQVRRKLQAGVSVLVFPEGTTGRGDTVMPFKTGAFQAVAAQGDAAVLPVFLDVSAVEGEPAERGRRYEVSHNNQTFARHCWHLFGLKHIDITVQVGTPIAAAGRDRKALASLAHQAVCALAERPLVNVN